MTTPAKDPCAAPAKHCGTPYGWRQGGRCVRCRTAHNVETSHYRGLSAEQRQHFLALLRAGQTIDEAAAAVGVTRRRLAAAAAGDGELRAALDGQPPEIQRAARLGDYLGALTRTGGDTRLAAVLCGMTENSVTAYRKEPAFAAAEEAVLAMVSASRRAYARVTDTQLDYVAQLIEGGASLAKAAEAAGITSASNLRHYAQRHPRLAAALPLRKRWEPSHFKRTPERLARLRELWTDASLTTHDISSLLEISHSTVRLWARQLDLPRRRRQTPSQGPDSAVAPTSVGITPRSTGTEGMIDRAVALLEDGATIRQAATGSGMSVSTLYKRARDHQRLHTVLATRSRHWKGGESPLAAESEQLLRQLWPDRSLTTEDIAMELGVSRRTVYTWVKRLALPPRPNGVRFSEEEATAMKVELRTLWQRTDLTTEDIADRLGVSRSTVANWRQELGLPSRTRGSSALPPSKNRPGRGTRTDPRDDS